MPPPLTDEIRYRLLAYLTERPDASQRKVAAHLGVSVGKVNYCMKALVEKGLVKIARFRKNEAKSVYVYLLTPKGIQEKLEVTYQFLKRKIEEYDALTTEIERLHQELHVMGGDRGGSPE